MILKTHKGTSNKTWVIMKFMLAATQKKHLTGNNKLIRHLLGQPLSSCVSNGAEYHHRTPETSWGDAQNQSTHGNTIQKSLPTFYL